MKFSDYIVFVDESGDHSLESIDPSYPIFVLTFCIFEKQAYFEQLVPKIKALKSELFGHDMVVLHEHDIRKRKGHFSKLSKDTREQFLNNLSDLIKEIDFRLLAVVIDKTDMVKKYKQPSHPYHLAMKFGLERLYMYLERKEQCSAITHIICEARGKREDQELELEFRRICDGSNMSSPTLPFDIVIADKKTNSEGLQIADLTARPVGLSVLRPNQQNRAYDVLNEKWLKNKSGQTEGIGKKVFP